MTNELPFNRIDDDIEFLDSLRSFFLSSNVDLYHELQQMVFNPFETNDDDHLMPLFDADPDIQFFNDIRAVNNISNCNYYSTKL